MTKKFSISKLLVLIFVSITVVSALLLTGVVTFVQHNSVNTIAKNGAHQQAELVFESLYSIMKKGWSRSDIDEIIDRFDTKLPNMHLRLIRSESVAQQFGDNAQAIAARNNDPLIQQAFATKQESIEEVDKQLRFIYPVIAQQECLGCHSNAKQGDVNGIIEITFPISSIGLPIEFAFNTLTSVFGLLFLAVLLITIISIRSLIAGPIINLSQYMRHLQDNNQHALPERSVIFEVESLRRSFSDLMNHLSEAHKEMESLTITDPLTKVANRRHFDLAMSQEIERAQRYSHPFSLIMLDLDQFKPINDTYGHEAGDLILQAISQALTQSLRKTDLLARVGGDEFQVICPETDQPRAQVLAEKLRCAVENTHVMYQEHSLNVSCSLGVATYDIDGHHADQLHRCADQRMYNDKLQRKNQQSTASR